MHYFGFYGDEYSDTQIASMLGITRQRVNQIKNKTLKKIKIRNNIIELLKN